MNLSQFILLFSLLFTNFLLDISINASEEKKIELGEFTFEDLQQNYSEIDSNASVIILYDFGHAYFNKYLEVEYKRHVRIKILKNDGFNWGNVKISCTKGHDRARIKDINGYTAFINDQKEIQVQELDNENIIEDEFDEKTTYVSFTLPSLRVGCIIEYSYKIESRSMHDFPREWIFQLEEPVLWSEYITEIPGIYRFAIMEQKSHPFYLNEQEEFSQPYTSRDNQNINLYLNGFKKRMVMQNLPALREEPYVKSVSDYFAKVTYQLASYNPPFSSKQQILQSWEELGKELYEHESFGERLEFSDEVKNMVSQIINPSEDENQKVIKIYNYVTNTVAWNKKYSIYASEFEIILNKKKGDSGDINLLLAALLKNAGIEIYPILISTRNNGTLFTEYPFIEQFNNVIIYVKTKDYQFVLDATDRLRPYFLLPKDDLNDLGLMLTPLEVKWINVNPPEKDVSIKVASIEIKEDGSIEGLMRITDDSFSALYDRKKIEEDGIDNFLNNVLNNEKTGLKPSSIKLTNNNEIDQPLIIDANLNSNIYSQIFDKMLYVNPKLMGKINENPFKQSERKFPVDYAYPIDKYYKINIALPSGFTLKEYPKTIKVGESEDCGYEREVTVNGNLLQFSTRFFINKIVFNSEEYSALRDFYDQIVKLENEVIVLEKI